MSPTEIAIESLLGRLESVIVPPDRELTLAQQTTVTNMSADTLLRRWKYDPDWFDAVYCVGKGGTDYRTTLARINACRDRASKRARQSFEEKSRPRKLERLQHDEVGVKRPMRSPG